MSSFNTKNWIHQLSEAYVYQILNETAEEILWNSLPREEQERRISSPPSYPTWTSGLTLPLTNPEHIIQLGRYHGMSGMDLHPEYAHISGYVDAHKTGIAFRTSVNSNTAR